MRALKRSLLRTLNPYGGPRYLEGYLKSKSPKERTLESYMDSVDELNLRFRESKLPFTYHNDYIQLVEEELTEKEIEEPFWHLQCLQ